MAPLKIVGFASGSPLSQMSMAVIAREHRLLAIVVPRWRGGLLQRLRRSVRRTISPLACLGAPLVDEREAAKFAPDIIVVATFPQIIPGATLAAARIGALNLHTSLLPRHRGVDPIFWTYWNDDSEAGVTIHWMTARLDAGDIAAQEAIAFERGLASRDLYLQLAARGTDLLCRLLKDIASGTAPREPQDEGRATYESAADIARARVPFGEWPAERVWHVLRGLGDQYSGLIADGAGRRLAHGRATGFRITSARHPGRVDLVGAGYEVHCCDGIVSVDRRN